jgi:hypothetical protein
MSWSVCHLLPGTPPGPAAAHPSSDHPRLVAKGGDGLRICVPIRAPCAKLQGAGERAEPRRAPRVRRGARGERLAVDEDEFEIFAAARLKFVGRVRVVRPREGLQQRAGRWRVLRVGGT